MGCKGLFACFSTSETTTRPLVVRLSAAAISSISSPKRLTPPYCPWRPAARRHRPNHRGRGAGRRLGYKTEWVEGRAAAGKQPHEARQEKPDAARPEVTCPSKPTCQTDRCQAPG